MGSGVFQLHLGWWSQRGKCEDSFLRHGESRWIISLSLETHTKDQRLDPPMETCFWICIISRDVFGSSKWRKSFDGKIGYGIWFPIIVDIQIPYRPGAIMAIDPNTIPWLGPFPHLYHPKARSTKSPFPNKPRSKKPSDTSMKYWLINRNAYNGLL